MIEIAILWLMSSGTSKTIGRGLVESNCAEDTKSTLKWLRVRGQC